MKEMKHVNQTESMREMNDVKLSTDSVSENMMLNDELDDEWFTEDEDIKFKLQKIKKASGDKFWKKMETWEVRASSVLNQLYSCSLLGPLSGEISKRLCGCQPK